MEDYPLISEYREAIMSPEDNFGELISLRPVLDSRGEPVMSSGNFAVVFKMRDEKTGKLYAVKCFTRPQKGRAESYRKITEELESVSSAYMVPMRWLDNELFVDTTQCDREEFPVVVMEWVEGEPLDAYVNRHLSDTDALSMLSYRFNRMAAWLLAQPFAHGDLKPDNILVREDGTPVLVDYDGMFVPSMQGEKAREAGSPDYRHPLRTDTDFNEHIDDFSVAVIALSLKALSLNPTLKKSASADTLLLSESDFRNPANSSLIQSISLLTTNPDLTILLGAFYIALAKKSLDLVSFRLFMTPKPKQTEKLSTVVTDEDIANGVEDEYGVVYSKDGKRLLKCKNENLTEYTIKAGTKAIGDYAFSWCKAIQNISIPSSVTAIGNEAFRWCPALSINIPSSVTTIGDNPFIDCASLHLNLSDNRHFRIIDNLLISNNGRLISCLNTDSHVNIPSSVTAIGNYAFSGCEALQSINIPLSVTAIGDYAFSNCLILHSISIPSSVKAIGKNPFIIFTRRLFLLDDEHLYLGVPKRKLKINLSYNKHFRIIDNLLISNNGRLISCLNTDSHVNIPSSVVTIDASAFYNCEALQSINIPTSVKTIGDEAFGWCGALQSINIPSSVEAIGKNAFPELCELIRDEEKISSPIINIKRKETKTNNNEIANGVKDEFGVIYSKDGKRLLTCKGRLTYYTVKSGTEIICDNAFWGQGSLLSLVIPTSVIIIGNSAFGECDSLSYIKLSKSITTIGNEAFIYCSKLQNITLPSSINKIGNSAFYGCSSLQSILIPNSITEISNEAFCLCESLNNVVLPPSITIIGDSAFYKCENLKNITIPSSINIIKDKAFYGCSSLQSILIPNSITSIGKAAFPTNCQVNRV
ncbi:MAG: leucine-rich repeat protein [Muribaculaceae bacterium]|nr:leucine-rich repeat protein [Muribaculaceae bacterium]